MAFKRSAVRFRLAPPLVIFSTFAIRPGRVHLSVLLLAMGAVLTGCSFGGGDDPKTSVAPKNIETLKIVFDPTRHPDGQWLHVPLSGETTYERVEFEDKVAMRATPDDSSSFLLRRVQIDPLRCRYLEINWAAEDVQGSANLHEKSGDDVAGSVIVAFGDPGTLFAPNSVPILRYVWTNELHSVDAVIDNPYQPAAVKNIVLRTDDDGEWRKDTRDLIADFRRAFNREPDETVQGIAIMTDNDQTEQSVEFYYGEVRSLCSG